MQAGAYHRNLKLMEYSFYLFIKLRTSRLYKVGYPILSQPWELHPENKGNAG